MSTHILVVDDDPHIRQVVRFALEKAGWRVSEARDGREGLELAQRHPPDLLVLDIAMPELDGTEVCRALRRTSQVPIVFLSARDDEIDRIVGLELGGDDYLTKPFSPRELVARIKAVLRRTTHTPAPEAPRLLHHGALTLDTDRIVARWGGAEVALTATEFGLLRTLMSRPGKVFSREELMDGAYTDHNVVSDRTIDSHIRRLRRKLTDLGGDPIETHHGIGYGLSACTPPR